MVWNKFDELTSFGLVDDLTCSSESMSTSMGSLVGGVSLKLLSWSDDRDPPGKFWEPISLDLAGVEPVCLGADLLKKLIRLFCVIFSEGVRFSGALWDGMMDVERDALARGNLSSRRRRALWHVCAIQI